jgi:uncharacterized C2H2 Zn-finger protein
MDTFKNLKNLKQYSCTNCNFITRQKNDYTRHLLTAKHIKIINSTEKNLKNLKMFKCDCGKEYKFSQGLSKHKKNCDYKPIEEPEQQHIGELTKIEPNINMFIDIIKENQEIKKLLLEQTIKVSEQNKEVIELHKENNILINKLVEKESTSITTINNNNNTTNNNNQSFNLNFFLNETCKDAMNMKEFIDNIKVTFEELLTIGNTGFVNGVSDIFIKRLTDMEVSKRPIHCTDLKRETIYLKEDNEWNKDEKENNKLKDAIEKVEYKNFYSLNEWCNENPDSRKLDTDNNQLWLKIYEKTLDGDERTRERVVKNITKRVTIDKE